MSEPSPPPFVVFRSQASRPAPEPYDRALELVAMVHEIVGKAATRFYLKDRLDRVATALVFELGRARTEVAPLRWRKYRTAQNHLTDVATFLDILASQKAAPELELQRARTLARELLADIAPRCNG